MRGWNNRGREGRSGATTVEYAVVLSMVLLVLAGGTYLLGRNLFGSFEKSGQEVASIAEKEGSDDPNGKESTPGKEEELFADDFDGRGRPDHKKWDWEGNSWQEKNGQLQAGYPQAKGEHRILAVGSETADGSVRTQATLDSGKGYGVFFRAQGDVGKVNGYSFEYDPSYQGGQFVLRKWINGYEIWPPVAAAPPVGNFVWTGVSRAVSVEMRGSTFQGLVDGQVVVTGSDSTYDRGQSGLRTWGGSQVAFDDFSVQGRRE